MPGVAVPLITLNLPDGKMIISGKFNVINGTATPGIVRLNQDGSLDSSFNCTVCNFNVGRVLLQPDGKILVSGYTQETLLTNIYTAIRLNSDGSLDGSFASPYNPTEQTSVAFMAVQPDGKILVQVSSGSANITFVSIRRLNTNGSFDDSFTTIEFAPGRTSYQFATQLLLLPNGKFLVSGGNAGSGSVGFLVRYNSDGTRDTTFESPVLTDSNFNSSRVNGFDVQPDGSIVFAGRFTSVNGIAKLNIARLLPAGNVDPAFDASAIFPIGAASDKIRVLSNGQILVMVNTNILYRLDSNGNIDNTFNQPANLSSINSWTLNAAERVLLFGGLSENETTRYRFARLAANGSLDATFNVAADLAGKVLHLAVQPDGKVIIAGDFDKVKNTPRNRLARINADGTLDTSFNFSGNPNGPIEKLAIQPDGKVLIGGRFSNFNAIFRLNADGTLDVGFNPAIPDSQTVKAIAVLSDGRILIGGDFTSINGTTRTGIALLNANGTLDNSFNAIAQGVNSILVEDGGKFVIGGSFTGVNGFSRRYLVRLNPDGSLDTAFNAGNLPLPVQQVERQPDGKYLIVTNTVARVNNDGSADASFQSLTFNGTINSMLRQTDGSIVIGGGFTTVGGESRLRLVRLRSNGSLDRSFFPAGANNPVRTLAKQPDDKILVGGEFTTIENVVRTGIARLISSAPPVQSGTRFDYDGDGKADVSVFRSANAFWYRLNSGNGAFVSTSYGTASDIIAPADYDGDGKTDLAFWRAAPNDESRFFITDSSTSAERSVRFGSPGDVPIPADWDGDGRADLAVYRAAQSAGGQSYFFYRPSSQPGVNFVTVAWGTQEDKPVIGDFDGDGRQDAAVFRPSTGGWYILQSSNNQFFGIGFGIAEDKPVPADFDGDGKTDIAVFRPSSGSWYRINSQTNQFVAVQFGTSGDIPAAADYDGDARADIAVFRPSNGMWYQQRSTAGFAIVQFGQNGDLPTPAAYVR